MLRVAFVNHHAGVPGGGEKSLETVLHRVPRDIDPHTVLFEEGVFCDQLRALDIRVHVAAASPRMMTTTRETLAGSLAPDCVRHVIRVRKVLRSLDVDVVVTSSMKAHVVGALAAGLCRIPVISWLQDMPDGLALKLVRGVIRSCSVARIACSRAVARHLALGHTTVLVPPIDLEYYSSIPSRNESRTLLGLPQNGLVFSIVGRIARWKGQDRFIRAAARICNQIVGVHFAIVGSPIFPQDHDFAAALAPLASELGVSERISFIPWLEDPRVAYGASDLICNASSAEPFGRTSVEAAACGVPTLCFNDGGAYEAVLQAVSGTVVPAGDIDAFAAAMAAYAVDPASLLHAGEAARVYAKRHDADRLAAAFFETIRRASAKREVVGGAAAARTAEA
jgi:glycosyltransferase involved in cell wall biosynthesis